MPILSREIEYVFGHKILSSRDCLTLSEEIFNKTGITINANTLRRFFGLVKSDYPPSAATLNILAKYCGCHSIEEVMSIKHENDASLVFTQECVLQFLIGIFKELTVKNVNDETFLFLVKHTVIFLNRNKQLIDKFQREIAKIKNGQEFYFEQFINIDKLASYYGDGLRYYITEKKTTEANVFAHSLLALRFWLTCEDEKLEIAFRHVCENKFSKDFHPFVCGRYFATQLYYAHAKGLPATSIIYEAQKLWSSLTPGKENYRSFPCFEYVFGEALVLTGHYEEGLMYIKAAFENYPTLQTYIDMGYHEKLKLWEAFALVKIGEEPSRSVNASNFYFLSKRYATILYLLTKLENKKNDKKIILQIKELIEETGFKRLSTLSTIYRRANPQCI